MTGAQKGPPVLEPGESMHACVPMAIQVVIDDAGWWSSEDGSARNEPFRSGCVRDHVISDYAAIIELGRRLGMRPQAAMVLCEWDRANILRALPSSTWLGERWDNSRRVGPWLDQAVACLREGAAHVELALHGVGHEFWSGGRLSRAEWHDQNGQMRPPAELRAHLDFFRRLLDQNGLGVFPSAFVPAAFLHSFGSGLAGILAEYGIRFISTPYGKIFRKRETEDACFGIEDGVLTVDRGNDLARWNVTGVTPDGEIPGPVCGMHWPNLLHADPARNSGVVEGWVKFLKPYDSRFDRMLAPDTASGFSQLVYHRWTKLAGDATGVALDFSKPAATGAAGLLNTFYLKVRAAANASFRADGLTILDARREPDQWRLLLQRTPGQTRARLEKM